MRESRTLGLIVPNIESRFFPRLRFSSEMRQGRLLSTSETDEGESPTSWAICLRVTLLAISLLPGLRAIS